MKKNKNMSGNELVKEMPINEALHQLVEYADGFIAWKRDRSAVYALAHNQQEMLAKLEELGVCPNQAKIDLICDPDNSFDNGFEIIEP